MQALVFQLLLHVRHVPADYLGSEFQPFLVFLAIEAESGFASVRAVDLADSLGLELLSTLATGFP